MSSNIGVYVNMKLDNTDSDIIENGQDEAPALPPRTKLPPSVVNQNHYERIRDREEDLKRIHYRSRELISGSGCSHVSHCRQRVQSPSRDDYKDFSALRHREMISPCRGNSYLSDHETTSSAESLNDLLTLRQLNKSWLQLTHENDHHHCCCQQQPQQYQYQICPVGDTSVQLSVENRLLALEGDKELLQLQFKQMSDKIHTQNSKVFVGVPSFFDFCIWVMYCQIVN